MKGKNTRKYLVTACIILLTASAAQAVSIGAGPSELDFKKMLKGGYGERIITVSTAGDEDLTITVETKGDTKDWITIQPSDTFNLPPKGRKEIKVVINPPLDTPNGAYTGNIYIRAAPTAVITEGTGSALAGAINIRLTAEITGEEVVEYKLQEVRVSDTEIGFPIRFNVTIKNTGNVIVTPTIHIDIYDSKRKNLLKTLDYSDLTINPTASESDEIVVQSKGLEVGKYVADLSTEIGGSSTVEFNVWERGTLAMKGILIQVSLNKIWVQVEELVEVNARFINRGELLIEDAKFKGQAYLVSDDFETEQLVGVFESDAMTVPVNREVTLTSHFQPTKPGRYIIRGSIVYGGKATIPKETILNVLPQEKNYTPYYIGVGILVILIVYFLLMRTEDGRTRRFKKMWGDYLKVK